MLSTGGLWAKSPIVNCRQWAPLFLVVIIAVSLVVSGGPARAQDTQQSAPPAQPTGITDETDSGHDDDLITNHTTISVLGVAANGAHVALTAAATRSGFEYGTTAFSNADAADGAYAIFLDLATATTDDLAAIPSGIIDGSWSITARQTETDKEESEPSPALVVTIDTRDPRFNLWVGYPDERTSGTATRVSSISGGVRGLASHRGNLYAVDDDTDALRRVDINTGEADLVGSFGSVEASPTGLASHNGVLYMVGGDGDALYSLDTTTGQPTQIGSFGSVEPTPTGLASHDGVLYMVGDDKDALYEIDITDGTAARVGSLGADQTPGGLASHNGILYMVGRGNNALYKIDTADGAATRINGGAESFGVDETSPSGLASHNGVLYMAGAANSALYGLSTGVVVPQPISGVAYLPRTTVVTRVSGIDEPGAITATRDVFGNTATWSGESSVFTFRDYEHESGDGPSTVTVEVTDAAGNTATRSQAIVIDTSAPSLTIDVPAIVTGAFTATFRFNEDVTWLDPIDIAVEEALLGTLEGSGSTYTALITPFDPAVITITVPARSVVDLAGNTGPARQVRESTRYDPPTPVTVEFTLATYQVEESGDTIALTLNLDQTPRREIVVPITVQPASTAVASSDYSLPYPSSVTFAADAAGTALTQTYTLTIIDDDYDEANETITLGFGTLPPNVSAGPLSTTTLTITDDDTQGIAASMPSEATSNIPEGGTYDYGVALTSKPTDTVTVTLSASPQGALTFSTGGNTPAESIDLTFTAGNWNIAQTVTATASVDSDDDDLTVTITHTASGGDYQALQRDETLTVVDNNVGPIFNPTSYNFDLPENLDGSSSPVNVGTPVSASDSDADDSISFTITSGNTDGKFAIHSTSGQITYIGSGEDFESSTTSYKLTVTATGGTGDRAQSATATVTVTITDVDDTPPSITSTSFATDGNAGYAKEGNTITVTFQTSEDLSAAPSATIAGQTATVTGSDKSWTATYTVEAGINANTALFDLGVVTDDADNRADPPAVDTGIVIDTNAPTVSIAGLPVQITGAFTVSFTFSESVNGFASDDITVVNGTLGTVTGSGRTYNATVTPADQGVVTMSVRADAAQDQAGNAGPVSMVTASSTETPITVAFTLATYQAEESGSTLALTLNLDQTPRREVVVPIIVQQTSTATSNSDYTLPDPSSVTFDADATGAALAQTYTLTIIDDDYDEANETIILGFGTLPANVSAGAQATTTATITDDDTRGIAVSMPPGSTRNIPEGGTHNYRVALTSKPTDTVTITLSGSPQGALTFATGDAIPDDSIDLIFTAGNWSTPQTVTATASVDPDDDDLTVTITHTASGGDYQALQHDEAFTVADNNSAPTFSPTSYSFDLPENLDGSSSPVNVGTPVSASDSDADDSVSYTLTDAKFAVHPTSGQITYTGSGEDFESSINSHPLTVTATGGAGNRAQSATATVTVTITDVDDTPPAVTSTTFVTDGNAGHAKEGNTITVTFQTGEELSATPSATIAGQTATVTGSDKNWTAAYTVEPGINDDNAAFDLGQISDADGNNADPPAVVTGIKIDSTAPTVTEVTPVRTPTTQASPSYVFLSDESGDVTYSGACGNGSVANVEADAETTTAFSALGVGSYADCRITVTDAAGNSGMVSVAPFTVQLDQSPAPARPSGIANHTDSGIDDDLITNITSIVVTGVAVNGASVSMTASATRGGTDYTVSKTATADAADGDFTIALDLATATTSDSSVIAAGSIDGEWRITARQTETGKSESEPSPALTVTIDTQDPTFKLWVGFPDGQTPGTVIKVSSISSSVTGLASHNGFLYAVDDSTDALYSVDLATDTASRTNDDVTNFGLGESPEKSPGGLASHNGVLYMVTDDDDALYSLDTSTGEATLIGSFGATETSPTGLTSHDGVLYMVGDSGDALYSIDPASGTASPVSLFSTVEQAPAGLASHNGVLYMVGDHSHALYSLDTATGEANLVGSFDSAEQTPTGLTSHDRVLYLTGAANSAIYTLSTGVSIPGPIDGVAYLPKGTVFVRISGIDDPGIAVATRTVFGGTDQQSGGNSVLTFSNYDSESDGMGTVVVEVTDAAGNKASLSRTVVVDTNAPRLTISGVPTVTNKVFTAAFEFNEVVTGFDAVGIMVENGTLSEFAAANAPVYSALITPTDQGQVTITVAAEAVADRAGNAGPQLQVSTTTLYDTHAPTVASVNTGNPGYAKEGDTITALVEISEALSITPSATIAGRAATVTGSGTQWKATYTVDGAVNADNAAFDLGAITDAAGNRNDPAAVDTGIEIDTTAPTVSYALPGSMRVEVSLPAIAPTDTPPTDGDFETHTYRVKFGTELPPGLSIDEVTGRITGTPTTASSAQRDTIIVAIDAAGNSQEVAVTFPAVDKGTQTLTGFAYSPSVVTFGGAAPVLVKPTGSQGDLSYTSDTLSVCTVEGLTGQLTIVGSGICTIKVSAAATDNYEEATAQTTVTVNPVGVLSLTLNTIAGDNTINAAEKATGLSITGNAGAEPIVSVTVTVGTVQLTPVISDSGGTWLVPIPPEPPYLVEPSVEIRVTATKAGSTAPTPVTRTVAVDITAPSVSYTAPSSLTVGVAIDNIDPTDADPTDDDYASHTYAVGAGSALPPGLSLDGANGRITGTPTTANTATQTTAITITDTAGNIQEVLIIFPKVAKGSQSLSGFSYNPTSIAFGDPVPELTAPTGAPGATIAYMSDTPLVCTVDASTGALTIVEDGICTITVTASETDDYQGATAQANVSVSPAGTLALSVDTIAGDDTVNAAEKAAGFSIAGRTGSEPATTVTVTIGAAELTAVTDGGGLWSVAVPPAARYLVDPSVSIEATAGKAGFIDATVVRTVIVDTIEPLISIVNPEQTSAAQAREFSAGDDDSGTTDWKYLVQPEGNCATVPPEEAVDYAEDDPVTLATEEFNTMHVCFWSTDAVGNVGSSISARLTGIDTTAPTVGYPAPASMRVGEEIAVVAPTDGVPTDDDFALHAYSVKPASTLPDGLSLDGGNGSITGTPTTASAGQTTTIVVTDAADNHQQVVVVFPEVAKGYQSLDDFAYNPSSIVFGDPAPALVAPLGAQDTLSYASDTQSVCTVQASTGALTIITDGTCTIELTAAATDDYEEATAQASVTVHPPTTLGLSVNTIAGDDTINAAEKAAGFAITGNTGLGFGASVTVAIGSFRLTATSGPGGAWSVSVPASAPYIVEPSATVLVSATKLGFPQARSVARTLTVDTIAPTVSYAAPASMRVGETIPDIAPTDDTPPDNDFVSHKYRVKPVGALPPGLSLDGATGRITGTPTAASSGPQTTTVVVTDKVGNLQEVVVNFPAVSKGHQSLTGFAYNPSSITFGGPAPALTAPTGAPGAAISYISNSPSVCAVDASTGALTIIANGTCTITATASSTDDYEGARAQTSVTVSPAVALPPINLAPVAISTLGDHRLTTVGPAVTVDVSMAFEDPDGDSLSYTATSGDDDVAAVSVSGSTATIRPLAAGWAAVTVTASDPDGLAATQIILVTVSLANQAPITVGTIAARTLTTGGRNVTLDMSSSFVDPDGDSLVYAAASTDRTVATVRLSGSLLTILPVGPGTAVATVVVRDPSGLAATQSIPVTVSPVTAVSSDTEVAEANASVDTSGAVTVTIRTNSAGHATITVMAPADDGASTVITAIELEVGEGLPAGTTIALPDSFARIGKSVTVSLLLSDEEITPPSSFSAVVPPLVVDITLSSIPSEPATICLPIDPATGVRTPLLLRYDESTDAWEEVSESPGIGPLVNGTQVKCADTKGSSTLAVAYRKNRDATLTTLSLNGLSLRPLFEAGLTEYEVSVTYDVETVTVSAIPSDAGASAVAVSPDDSSASTMDHQVPLEVGENVITVTVTAEDASVTGTYTITVTRAPSLEVVSEPSPKPTPPRTGGV